MSKELVISVGIPYSGRTSWLNKTYSQEGTVIIEEDKYEGMMKDGKVQEKNFYLSNEWVTSQVKQLMEAETPCARIVVSYFQSRPDHWLSVLKLAIEHEYTLTVVIPKNGYLYYPSNKFGRNQEQVEWIQRTTIGRFPRVSKEKKKSKTEDEEEEKENPNLYSNIVTEYMSAYAFILQNRNECQSDSKKWFSSISSHYKSVITRTELEKTRRAAEAAKQAATKAKEEAARAAIEARKQAKEAKDAKIESKVEVQETSQTVETSA